MTSFSIVNILPFWILGLPLAIAIISYVRLPARRDLVAVDRRQQRSNIVREPIIEAGDTAVSRG